MGHGTRILWAVWVILTIAIVNIIFLLYLPILFVSRKHYRRLAEELASLLWLGYPYSIEYFTGNKLVLTGDKLPHDENAIVLSNHLFWTDWTIIFCLAARRGIVGSVKIIVKNIIKYIPGIGTGILALGSVFISRSWEKDQEEMRKAFSHLISDEMPFWLLLFPEGTRLTPQNVISGQEFARKKGYPILKNLSFPKVKGFQAAVKHLRYGANAVYDITIAYPEKPGNIYNFMFGGKPKRVHVHIKRIEMSAIPEDEDEQTRWLINNFVEKDQLIEYFRIHGVFPGKEVHEPYTADMKTKAEKNFIMWSLGNILVWCLLFFIFSFFSYQR
eukprot:TRINITY_DN6360_c0_g3_i1.p1 TRINITY_DN6360_c0_g3~~TRINITY_DN6360_c0_g3_i1.p1  ORF type:complete len:329 (-),score=35.01 TRINITY_DN6360_c0_g3_i1:58-1044(-)